MDIENLSLEELNELHHKLYNRVKELHKKHLLEKLQSFEIGERVSFNHGGKTITGTVTRVNQNTLSVKTKEDGGWYVDPGAGTTKIQLPWEGDDGNVYSRIEEVCICAKNEIFRTLKGC